MYDVLESLPEKTISCLDKGHVTLVDVMPRLVPEDTKTADYAVVQAARVSYGQGTKTINEDRGLIRYLMRHDHTTPTEMVEFKFHCKLPIVVARQMVRSRTASLNEISGRYSVLKDDFYIPDCDNIREQSTTNKQGGDSVVDSSCAAEFNGYLQDICEKTYENYQQFLDKGISREQARMVLPLNLYTEWYWKIDLHNLLRFLALRCDSHAQKEIRVYAEAMLQLITPIVPFTVEAWNDYHHYRGAVKLSKLEVTALRHSLAENRFIPIDSSNKREQAEWAEKAKAFGLNS